MNRSWGARPPAASSAARRRAPAGVSSPSSGSQFERDLMAMRQVWDLLRTGAVRMWGEIGRTT
ncbi:hypothetical protein [Aphanothece stagnina]|uniref:hypothetical protein n=1 Tax=Aphanothece stagnina TaxID=1004305 RepID=UPI00398F4EFB